MPGPPPNPNSRKQSRGLSAGLWVELPAEGYQGPLPRWPLETVPYDKLIRSVWRRVWRTPQAAAWIQLGWLDEVANYTRLVAASQSPELDLKVLTECRQYADRLGLNTMAMLRHHWRIRAADISHVPATAPTPRRILTVADDAVAGA